MEAVRIQIISIVYTKPKLQTTLQRQRRELFVHLLPKSLQAALPKQNARKINKPLARPFRRTEKRPNPFRKKRRRDMQILPSRADIKSR
jgi:hypothetical protein